MKAVKPRARSSESSSSQLYLQIALPLDSLLCAGMESIGSSYLLGLCCAFMDVLSNGHGRSHTRQAKQISTDPLLMKRILSRIQWIQRPSELKVDIQMWGIAGDVRLSYSKNTSARLDSTHLSTFT
jgi:hypothetical protein